MAGKAFLAVDLGASSGRHVAATFNGDRLALREIHRFDNGPINAAGHMYWDTLALWSHVVAGLRRAASELGPGAIASIGVDTWGVDFVLLGAGDEMLGYPFHYRDRQTDGMLERAFEIVPRSDIFAETGLQFMQINSLYQLLAMRLRNSPLLAAAESFLMMPDFFNWLLTGVKSNEMTDSTTTQLFDPTRRDWADVLIAQLDLPRKIFGPIVEPGARLGKLRSQVAAETGLANVEVILPGTHDTASAVMAVPASGAPSARPNWCYISSGTWSLMGVEVPGPVINAKCRQLNFTNEGGVGGTIRLLKNITGLWLAQECRRVWSQAGCEYSWEQLTQMANAAPRLASLINPDAADFAAPDSMPEAIRAFCKRVGEPVPDSEGAVIRAAIESLALRYRQVLGWLEELVGGRIDTIHVIGGGCQNRQLCQATADACGRVVLAGPVEATAIGNALMQAVSTGAVGSIAEARELARRSFPVERYEPRDTVAWDEAYARFVKIVG